MKFLKAITLTALALIFTHAAQAQTVGVIKAFLVKGDVTIVNNATGATMPLERGQEFGQGYTVVTGAKSSALLLFSNGASVQVSPESKLDISQFEQASYDPELGSFLRLEKDPSLSKTATKLEYGQVIGEVRKLNLDAGSSFVVNTPTASAGIRGTVWVVTYNPETGAFTTTNVTGDVTVVLPDGTQVPVPAEETYVLLSVEGGSLQDMDPQVYAQAKSFMAVIENVTGWPGAIVGQTTITPDVKTTIITEDVGAAPEPGSPSEPIGVSVETTSFN